MDDSCAVCAEALEWVAYGACGHREVCSTCVSRLRFICDDRRCCICKTPSDVVFVTKASGDYTRMINDFSVFPYERREGQVGSYWYHEDTQAFFDDMDHYKMVKAMCKLSCSVCDKMEEQPNDEPKRRAKFRNIGQLKGHLFHQHKLHMCGLCLEGRKIFICEQKLYTRGQLNQHISTGDSEVDGSESERGGFAGHPMCEFCRTSFYGDNELYTHMSTEHYTCHICQRLHPGQFEYYKNYDDLENHFSREHFLCEDEACLAKKFVVFQSEAEMKKHNTLEHGGRMSRSKRNAALQIPTSFRYRRNNEQDHHRGRGLSFHPDPTDDQLSMAIQASLETVNANGALRDPASSSSTQAVSDHIDRNYIDPIIQPFDSLTTTESELPSRYRQALGNNSSVTLGQSSFPPLSMAPGSTQQKPNDSDSLSNNTMAAHLRRKNKKNLAVPSSAPAWPAASRGPAASFNLNQSRVNKNTRPSLHSSGTAAAGSSYSTSTPSQDQSATFPVVQSTDYLRKAGKSSRISHSASAPNLIQNGSSEPSASDFPSVSATKLPSRQPVLNVENVNTANKSLVEKIRIALDFDEDKYTAFKEISGQYRQNSIDSRRYLDYVQQFGLSQLLLDLASLCPDTRKQKELIDTYNANLQRSGLQEDGWGHGSFHVKDSSDSKRGIGKSVNAEQSNKKDNLADSFMNTVRKLQSSNNPSEEDSENLSKDGYRASKGKSSAMVDAGQSFPKLGGHNNSSSVTGDTSQSSGDGGGGSKQRKKTSKFQRVRLGDGSMAALLDKKYHEPDPDPVEERKDGKSNQVGGLPARGVWRNGGGQKLFP